MAVGRLIKKTLLGVSLLALIAAAGGGGATLYLFRRALPAENATARLAGLKEHVSIFRDAYGVPHIFAQNDIDAARALGYTHASERSFQMEMQRRAGQGRLSELLGPDMLGIDKFVRTLGLYELARHSFTALSPEAQTIFQAYADGVNDWLDTHRNRLPPEFLLLGDRPEPWQVADSMVWGKLMALELSHNEHMEILRARLLPKLGAERLAWLFPMPAKDAPLTTQPVSPSSSSGAGKANTELAAFIGLDHAASNEWAVDGAHSVTGKPLLANDPHLGLEAPILWYLARIVTPQGSVKGATVPGLPVVLLGQNDHMAWGFTTTGSDVEDLFVESLDPADSGTYLTPSGSQAFTLRHEVIHVKDGADVDLTVRATRHGPVLSDIDPDLAQLAGPGKVMALAFTGLGDRDTTPEALLRMNRAANAGDFLDALKLYQTPPQNIVYADDQDTVGFIAPGLVPIRKKGDGLLPVDGASGDYDWIGTVPFAQAPQLVNPANGYIFNANNPLTAPEALPYLGQDWEEAYRARCLQEFFTTIGRFDLHQFASMQADHVSLAARDLLPLLLAAPARDARGQQALDMLRAWDGTMDKDRAEPAMFEAWLYEFHRHMFLEKIGDPLEEKGPFAASVLESLTRVHAADWCGAPDPDCRNLMAQSLSDGLDLLTARQGRDMRAWRWGRENIAQLQHKFYSHIPLLDKFSDLSVESSGDFYTLDRGGGFDNKPDRPFARAHGGGYRGLYDLANPEASRFMIATGESGHIFSPHYGDLTPLWNQVLSIPLAGTLESFQKSAAPQLTLTP